MSEKIEMDTIHIMIDFEAWDKICTAKPRSLGLCTFGNSKLRQVKRYWNVDQEDPALNKCSISESTVEWWCKQDVDAHKPFTDPRHSTCKIREILQEVNDIFDQYLEEGIMPILWANGTDYDLAMIYYLFRVCNMEPVWFHSNVSDMRTVRKTYQRVVEESNDKVWKGKIKHFALDDAIGQGEMLEIIARYNPWILRQKTLHRENCIRNPDFKWG